MVHQPRLFTGSLKENEYISEIPKKVKALVFQFADLLNREIFANKFQPMNLYKLYHMKKWDNIYCD